jgi:hypothetical protein
MAVRLENRRARLRLSSDLTGPFDGITRKRLGGCDVQVIPVSLAYRRFLFAHKASWRDLAGDSTTAGGY